jgi:methyl-accepting chemotaxis protein
MFQRMKFGSRLIVGFAVVLAALVMIGALSAKTIKEAIAISHLTAERNAKTSALSVAQSMVWSLRWDIAQFLAVTDPVTRKQIVDRAPETRKHLEDALAIYAKTQRGELTREEITQMGEFTTAFRRYTDARLKWFDLYGNGKTEEALAFRADTLTPSGGQTVAALGKLIQLQEKLVEVGEQGAVDQLDHSLSLLVGAVALALIAGIAGGVAITRGLLQELGGEPAYAKEVATRIAQGDLTVDVLVKPNDRVSLVYAMSQMSQSLRQLVGEVAGGAHAVSDTSAQIAQGNVDLSQRTEEQASTLEETASSLEELTSTVTQNAHNARQASQLAAGASEVARKGGTVVGQVVTTMTGISESSRKIADIISVIDAIAFQTNILALNAAVEAARAGEQGRGFAVVAAEVRNLAQRSAAAAKEIKTLIGDSVDKVDAGTKLVDAAGKTMEEIVGSVKQVTDLIAEIAAASQEQSSGIEQVNTAITQMDQVVQQNASLVEEATAATESMKEQAGSLLQMVSRFQLGGQEAPHRAAPAPGPAAPRKFAPVMASASPIRFRANARPVAAMAAVLAAPLGAKAPANGEWKEF